MTSPARSKRRNGEAENALAAVLQAAPSPMTVPEIMAAMDACDSYVRDLVNSMVEARQAHSPGRLGSRKLYAHGPYPGKAKADAAVARKMREVADAAAQKPPGMPYRGNPESCYDGRELRPYQGRPGAMDAYALPSLHAGQAMPRRAPASIGTRWFTSDPTGQRT